MDIMLAENIRMFRKQRSLTQEQLSEVLGVTTGAVYKWEAKMSLPELNMIVKMADFFDTSIDALLGYKMQDNCLAATLQRLKDYRHDKDYSSLSEAEKALKKYPHSFKVVHECAITYRVFGIEKQDIKLLCRALELLDESRLLLSQNQEPEISDLTIYGEMADIYLILDKGEKAIELLKKHNSKGVYNDIIGLTLATNRKRPEDAVPFLSEALIQNITSIIRTIIGLINVFCMRGDYSSAKGIIDWGIDFLSGLKQSDKPSFLDKINGIFYVCLAYTQVKTENIGGALISLKKAKTLAINFDTAPNYEINSFRFIDRTDRACVHDNLGETAKESLEKTVTTFEEKTLSTLWKEVNEYDE